MNYQDRNRLREFLDQLPEFQAETPDNQDHIVEQLSADRDMFRIFMNRLPDFQAESLEDQEYILEKLHPGMHDNRARAMLRQADDFVIDAQHRLTGPVAAGATRLIGSAMNLIGGAAHLGADVLSTMPEGSVPGAFRVSNEEEPDKVRMLSDLIRDAGVRLKADARQAFNDSESIRKDFTMLGGAAFDVAVTATEMLPAMLATYATGGLTAPIMAGMAQGYLNKYGDLREVGYSPFQSGVGATPTALGQGAMSGLNAKFLTTMGKSAFKHALKMAGADFATSFGAQTINLVTDAVIDKFWRENHQMMLLDPEKDYMGYFQEFAYRSLIDVAAGQAYYWPTTLYRKTAIWANHGAEVELPSGEAVVVPEDIAPAVERYIEALPADKQNAQYVSEAVQHMLTAKQALGAYEAAIKNVEDRGPVVNDLQKLAPTLAEGTVLQKGMKVGVAPEAIGLVSEKPVQAEYPAKILKVLDDGKVAVQLLESKQSKVVDAQHLRMERNPINLWQGVSESPALVLEFAKVLTDPTFTIPPEHLTPEQARLYHGAVASVVQQMKALGGASSKKGYIKLVYDAMANDHGSAARILAHEVGHFLWDLSPDAIKKLGMEHFAAFKEFSNWGDLEHQLSPDVLARFQKYQAKLKSSDPKRETKLQNWVLRNHYGSDLQSLWDMYALFRTPQMEQSPTGVWHGGNVNELMANALSVFINELSKTPGTPSNKQVVNTQLYKDFMDWVSLNPRVRQAVDAMQSMSTRPLDAVHQRIARRKANDIQSMELEKRRRGVIEPTADYFRFLFENEYHFLMKAVGYAPEIRDKIDGMLLGNATSNRFIDGVITPVLEMCKSVGLKYEHFVDWVENNRIENDRFLKEYALAEESQFKNPEQYKKTRAKLRDQIIDQITKANPDISDTELGRTLKSQLDAAFADDVLLTRTYEMLNPDGRTAKSARADNAYLSSLYPQDFGFEKVCRELWDNFHAEKNKWILKALEESKLYSPELLAHMQDNDNWAAFQYMHHEYYAQRQSRSGVGSPAEIHRQWGGLGEIKDAFAASVERLINLESSARKAATLREALKFAAEHESSTGVDRPMVLKVEDPHSKTPVGYERVITHEYVKGIKKNLIFDADAKVLAGFKKGDGWFYNTMNFVSQFTAPLKAHMTVYNPFFWMTNWLRDTSRTIINAPGYLAPIAEIPLRSIAEGVADFGYEAVLGKPNPRKEALAKRAALQEAGNYGEIMYAQSPKEKHMARVGKLSQFRGLEETGKFSAAIGWAKQKALAFGEAVEFSSKAAMSGYLDAHYPNMPEIQKLDLIRNFAGTPLLARKGALNPLMSNWMIFYNPNIQGLVTDIRASNRPDVWVKRLALTLMTQMPVAMAKHGYFGDEWQDFMRRINEYDYGRSPIIPIGWSREGVPVFQIVRVDQTTESLFKMFHATMDKIHDGTYTFQDAGGDILDSIDNQFPSENPWLGAVRAIHSAATTEKGPVDFRNEYVIPEHIRKEGDALKSTAYVARDIWNKGFGMSGLRLTRFQFSSKDEELRQAVAPHAKASKTLSNHVASVLNDLLNFNIGGMKILTGPNLSTMLKVGNRGLQEHIRRVGLEEEQRKAKEYNIMVNAMNKLVFEHKLPNDHEEQLLEQHSKKVENFIELFEFVKETAGTDERLIGPARELIKALGQDNEARWEEALEIYMSIYKRVIQE